MPPRYLYDYNPWVGRCGPCCGPCCGPYYGPYYGSGYGPFYGGYGPYYGSGYGYGPYDTPLALAAAGVSPSWRYY